MTLKKIPVTRVNSKPKNQCDGCARKLPLRNGNHVDENGRVVMGCTKEKYKGVA